MIDLSRLKYLRLTPFGMLVTGLLLGGGIGYQFADLLRAPTSPVSATPVLDSAYPCRLAAGPFRGAPIPTLVVIANPGSRGSTVYSPGLRWPGDNRVYRCVVLRGPGA